MISPVGTTFACVETQLYSFPYAFGLVGVHSHSLPKRDPRGENENSFISQVGQRQIIRAQRAAQEMERRKKGDEGLNEKRLQMQITHNQFNKQKKNEIFCILISKYTEYRLICPHSKYWRYY